MRPDFNKLLVERERAGHKRRFHENRRMKQFDKVDGPGGEYAFGGRESMRKRYKVTGNNKSFNENLNPLKGWLHSCLGKKWDKCYSELRKTFDARGVINNHILEHLFDYVEVNTKVVDGIVMVLDGYNGSKGYVPLKKRQYNMRWPEYYVCPKDGTLKTMHKPPRRSIVKEAEARKQREIDAVFRKIDDKTHLRLMDGVWYAFDVLPLPPVVVEVYNPYPADHVFTVSRSYSPLKKQKVWAEMNADERKQHGRTRIVSGLVTDEFTGERVSRSDYARGYQSSRRYGVYSYGAPTLAVHQYYANKRTASHKLLKAAGVVGTAAANDESVMSHREASKYRKAA